MPSSLVRRTMKALTLLRGGDRIRKWADGLAFIGPRCHGKMMEHSGEIGQSDLGCAPDAQQPRKSPGSGNKIGSDPSRAGVTLGVHEGKEARVEGMVSGIGNGAEGMERDAALLRILGGDGGFHIHGKGTGFTVKRGLGRGCGDDVVGGMNAALTKGEGARRTGGQGGIEHDITDRQIRSKGTCKSGHDQEFRINVGDEAGQAAGADARDPKGDIVAEGQAGAQGGFVQMKSPGDGPGFRINGSQDQEAAASHGYRLYVAAGDDAPGCAASGRLEFHRVEVAPVIQEFLGGFEVLAGEGDREMGSLVLVGNRDTLVGKVFDEVPHAGKRDLCGGETGRID